MMRRRILQLGGLAAGGGLAQILDNYWLGSLKPQKEFDFAAQLPDASVEIMLLEAAGNGHLGERAADDTNVLQAIFDRLRLTRPKSRQRDSQRVLDLRGRQYRVTSPLSLVGCDGLEIRNGTLVVTPSTPFPHDRAILEHDVPSAELWGLTLRNVTLQCNHASNGLNLQRPQECFLDNPTVVGWGSREYGIRLGPSAYSADTSIVAARVSGAAVTFEDNPVAARTGIGIDLQTADTEIIGGVIDSGKKCLLIHSSASVKAAHVWNGSPGSEELAEPNNIGIEYVSNHSAVSNLLGNTFDNCCIVFNGSMRNKLAVSNYFYSNQKTLEACIFLRLTDHITTLSDVLITDNLARGYYARFITIDGVYSGFDSVAERVLLRDNLVSSLSAGRGGYAESLTATQGTFEVEIKSDDFNSHAVVQLELGKRALLLPGFDRVLGIDVSIMRSSASELAGSSVVYQGWWYDKRTGLLSVKFSKPFGGRLRIDFDQAGMGPLLSPPPK